MSAPPKPDQLQYSADQAKSLITDIKHISRIDREKRDTARRKLVEIISAAERALEEIGGHYG